MINNKPSSPDDLDLDALIESALAGDEKALRGMPELSPLLAELELALESSGVNFSWLYSRKVFHAEVWNDSHHNLYVVVVRETAKSVFFARVPSTRETSHSEPGSPAYGIEKPDLSVTRTLLSCPRSDQSIGSKLAPTFAQSSEGPAFKAGGLRYKVWNGQSNAYDHRRE